MTVREFLFANEVSYLRNGYIVTQWEWLNEGKQFFLFKLCYINKPLYLEKHLII